MTMAATAGPYSSRSSGAAPDSQRNSVASSGRGSSGLVSAHAVSIAIRPPPSRLVSSTASTTSYGSLAGREPLNEEGCPLAYRRLVADARPGVEDEPPAAEPGRQLREQRRRARPRCAAWRAAAPR